MVARRKLWYLSLSVLVVFICVKYVLFTNQYTTKTDSQNFQAISVSPQTVTSPSSLSFQDDLLSGIPLKCPIGGSYSEVELLLKKYERFLKTLEDYVSYHDKSPSRRTLVWWCASYMHCGGLGDRTRSIAYAFLLAIISRRRLVIVWPTHSEGDFLHPHMINWKDNVVSKLLERRARDRLDSDDFIGPHLMLKTFSSTETNKTKESMEYYMKIIGSNETNVIISITLQASSLLYVEINGNNPDWLMEGMQLHGFSNLSMNELDDMVGIVFRYLFKMDHEVLERTSAAAEVLGLNHLPYVAVHVRTGFAKMPHFDELSIHPKLLRKESEWKRALQCAIHAADELSGKNRTNIFLATDSNRVKQIAVNKYGTRIRTLNNVIIHVDKLKKKPHPLSAEEKEGFIVLWVEFLLIAQGKILVRGDSGFSRVAGLLCGMYEGSRTLRIIGKCS